MILLLLVSALLVKSHTYQHLMVMQNISARQGTLVNGRYQSFKVSILEDRQHGEAPPLPYVGLRLGPIWFSILQDSQLWHFKPEGDHFTYRDQCYWQETKRIALWPDSHWEGYVPCYGEIFVDGEGNIKRITQTMLIGKFFKKLTLIMDYDWIPLKAPRLVPVEARVQVDNMKALVRWDNYHELAGNEPVVTEIEGP